MQEQPGEITVLLSRLTAEKDAAATLLPLVYDDLRRMASHCLRRERMDHTLQTCDLVSETFLKLFQGSVASWQNRRHFFSVAAQAMRHILVDHARSKCAEKREGYRERLPLESAILVAEQRPRDMLAIDEALVRLAHWDTRQCQIVELRFFGGLSIEETADVLGVSARTVKRDWRMAKAWLQGELTEHGTRTMVAAQRSL